MNEIPVLLGVLISMGIFATEPVLADSELPPVYQEGQLILDRTRYTFGDTINVTVTSPLNNTDPNALDTMMTADSLGLETKHIAQLSSHSLIESGPDTGIFVGKFQIIKSGDKPPENSESIDGYLEVSPDTDSVSVRLQRLLVNGTFGQSADLTHPSDPTSDDFTYRMISAYPNTQFRWKESISPNEGIGIIRVAYPEQNISDKVDSLVVRLLYDYGRIFVTLNETDKDTGVFETEIPVTTQYSPTKLTLKPSQWQRVSVDYYVDDHLYPHNHDGFNLYNSLASSDSKPNDMANPVTIRTDNDWYLSNQQITINGQAEPNEALNIAVFSKKENGQEKFRLVKADSIGSFSTSIIWNEQRFISGGHIIEIVGSKHDEISTKDIMIVSLDQLHSHSFDVSPKRQLQMGILPEDIVCEMVLHLVFNPSDKSPACVRPDTKQILIERGWAETLRNITLEKPDHSLEFEGVIIDNSLDREHQYFFLTNDPARKFNTGSSGIRLEGIDDKDNLHGKRVKIFGAIEKNGEDKIRVYEIQVLGSLIPKGDSSNNGIFEVSLDELLENPDTYYNQMIRISGELREYDNPLAHTGVGCYVANYTTSDGFVPDFVSRRQLHDENHRIGVRVGSHDDVGYSEFDKLPLSIKNKEVAITGTLIPTIKDSGACNHVIYKSGYILTDLDKIKAR